MDPSEVNSWPNGWVSIDKHKEFPNNGLDDTPIPEQTNVVNDVNIAEYEIDEIDEIDEDVKNVPINPDTGAPDYNYIDKVPKFLKYPKKANLFDYIYTIEDNATRATGILITGKEDCPNNNKKNDFRIGERYYFESGKCGENSTPDCIGKPRNIIVNNLPGKIKNNEGLIPNIIGDFGAFEPVEIIKSLNGEGVTVNNKCSLKNIEVTQLNPGTKAYRSTKKLCVPDYSLPSKTIYKDDDDEERESFKVHLNDTSMSSLHTVITEQNNTLFFTTIFALSFLLIYKLKVRP